MEEKIYTTKRKGMAVLLTVLFVYLIAITGTVFGAVKYEDSAETGYLVLMVVSIVVLSLGWFPLIGLRVLKPQEALVLTLFGKYVGTIREAGFYFVNPFCTAINPAAATKLAQSGGYPADSSEECIFHLCGWYICIGRWFYIRKEDFIKGDDTEQWQTEDQRLSR